MNRTAFLLHTRQAVRVALYSALGTGTIAVAGFAGTHYYIESKDPTPAQWPRELRFAYRASVFNERYLDQRVAARVGLEATLQYLEEKQQEETMSAGVSSSAAAEARPRYPKALIRLAQLERGQGRIEAAQKHLLQALDRNTKDDTFELMTPALESSAYRHLGEIQERLGRVTEAQTSFHRALRAVIPTHDDKTIPQLDLVIEFLPERVDAVKALALSRARQGHYKEALESLLSLLQYQRQHPVVTNASCSTASTMSNIAELVWALGDVRECRRWNEEALSITTDKGNAEQKYCLECAGISHNMLGLLSKLQGDTQAAQGHFTRALICAERADDIYGMEEYSLNLHAAH